MGFTSELIDGIQVLIDRSIKKAKYDKTYTGVIVEIVTKELETKTIITGYKVKINQEEYILNHIGAAELKVGQVVHVLLPQNNMVNAFILE